MNRQECRTKRIDSVCAVAWIPLCARDGPVIKWGRGEGGTLLIHVVWTQCALGLRRLDPLDTINNFEKLNFNIILSLCNCEMNGSFHYCTKKNKPLVNGSFRRTLLVQELHIVTRINKYLYKANKATWKWSILSNIQSY